MSKPATDRQTVRLREACSLSGCSHATDGEGPVIRGVKILGPDSRNGRRYTTEARTQGLPLYEGIKVNIDHPEGSNPNKPRGLRDRFGRLVNVRVTDGYLEGDLRYNPRHPMAPLVEWWAQNDPNCLGLSHNAVGQGRTENGVFVIDRIVSVRSVDLVADPATVKGLLEEAMDDELDNVPDETTGGDGGDYEQHLGHTVSAILKDAELSVAEKKKKILAALKLLDDKGDEGGDDEAETEEEMDDDKDKGCAKEGLELLRDSKDPAVKALVERLDRLEAKDRLAARREQVKEACKAARLPDILVTDVFLEQLVSAADDKTVKALIEDRRTLGRVSKPRSAAPHSGAKMDVKTFARSVREGVN